MIKRGNRGQMQILAFIEDPKVMEKILKHLSFWDLKFRPLPKVKAPSVTLSIDDSDYQATFSALPFYPDPNYPMDSCGISSPRGVTPLVAISAIDLLFFSYYECFDMISRSNSH